MNNPKEPPRNTPTPTPVNASSGEERETFVPPKRKIRPTTEELKIVRKDEHKKQNPATKDWWKDVGQHVLSKYKKEHPTQPRSKYDLKLEKKGGEMEELREETIDKIEMSVPLFIRALEWAREDAKDDVEIHKFVENCLKVGGELDTDDYEKLLPEATQDNPPFVSTGKSKGDVVDKSGAKHTSLSRAKHLARLGLKSQTKKQVKESRAAELIRAIIEEKKKKDKFNAKPEISDSIVRDQTQQQNNSNS